MDGESWDEKVEQLSRLVEGISAATPAIATPPAAIKNVAA
jgi:hypothetical protein